jgi:hypothetical protein
MGIYKYNCNAGPWFILAKLKDMGYELDQCLVFSNGILLDIREVKLHCKRSKFPASKPEIGPPSQNIVFVPLPFTFSRLSDLEYFKAFQRLLWHTGVHFDSCFDRNIWAMNGQGLYCRSDTLISGLTDLTRLHNMICAALECIKSGNTENGWIKIRTAFVSLRAVTQTQHHRQLPDLLAILLLLERSGRSDVREALTRALCHWADLDLPHNDPRKKIFPELLQLQIDRSGHLYIAFDAACRRLWMNKVGGTDPIKAYYAYNQASLPRTTPGEFYSLYEGKSNIEIRVILQEVDQKFAPFEHARICLWHTAIRYLYQEKKNYEGAEVICTQLLVSVLQCQGPQIQSQWRQWNVDISLTFYLLGSIYESLHRLWESIRCFMFCVIKRSEVVPEEIWDPTKCGALNKAQELAYRFGILDIADYSTTQLTAIDFTLAREDHIR